MFGGLSFVILGCLRHLDGLEIFLNNHVKLVSDFLDLEDVAFRGESSGSFCVPCRHVGPVKELTIAVTFAFECSSPAIQIFSLRSHVERLPMPSCLQIASLFPELEGFAETRHLG